MSEIKTTRQIQREKQLRICPRCTAPTKLIMDQYRYAQCTVCELRGKPEFSSINAVLRWNKHQYDFNHIPEYKEFIKHG